MPSPRSMLRQMLLVPMLLAATACVSSPPIYAARTPCGELIPTEWSNGVGHATPPAEVVDPLAQLKEWIKFGTAEAGQVEKADARYRDSHGIRDRCEARDKEAVQRSRPKFLGLF